MLFGQFFRILLDGKPAGEAQLLMSQIIAVLLSAHCSIFLLMI